MWRGAALLVPPPNSPRTFIRSQKWEETITMKIAVVALVLGAILSLAIAGFAMDADAVDHSKSRKHHAKTHHPRYVGPGQNYMHKYPDASGWFPHDSNELPFGSRLWWEQMEREGRLNRETN
jgi:hypothetical protein